METCFLLIDRASAARSTSESRSTTSIHVVMRHWREDRPETPRRPSTPPASRTNWLPGRPRRRSIADTAKPAGTAGTADGDASADGAGASMTLRVAARGRHAAVVLTGVARLGTRGRAVDHGSSSVGSSHRDERTLSNEEKLVNPRRCRGGDAIPPKTAKKRPSAGRTASRGGGRPPPSGRLPPRPGGLGPVTYGGIGTTRPRRRRRHASLLSSVGTEGEPRKTPPMRAEREQATAPILSRLGGTAPVRRAPSAAKLPRSRTGQRWVSVLT